MAVDIIYETIAFVGSGLPVYFDARLRECDYGEWTG